MINLCMQPELLTVPGSHYASTEVSWPLLAAIMYSSKDISVYNTKYNNVLPITLLIIITNITF